MFSPSNFSFTSSTLTQTAGFVYNYDRGGNLSVSTALHDSGLSPKKWDLSRLAWGRVEFLSTDPLAGQFAGLTPYVFAGGSPIKNIDYLGLAPLDIIYLDADNNELYRVAADGAHTYKQLVNDVDLSTQAWAELKTGCNGRILTVLCR